MYLGKYEVAEIGSCFTFTLKKSEFLGIKLGVTWRGQR